MYDDIRGNAAMMRAAAIMRAAGLLRSMGRGTLVWVCGRVYAEALPCMAKLHLP